MTIERDHTSTVDIWSAHPDFPTNPAFYRRVLDLMPSPLIVVNDNGLIVYANEALMRVAGRTKEQGILTSIFDYIHADDIASLVEAFMVLASSEGEVPDRPWAPVHFRMVHPSGTAIPVEVTGRSLVADPDVGGVVYDIRPAVERDIFQRVLSGVGESGSTSALELVVELVVASTLEIDAAVLVHDDSGVIDVLSTSDARLHDVLVSGMRELAWCTTSSTSPTFVPTESIAGLTGMRIRELGFRDAWSIDVASPMPTRRYAIVAFTPVRHVPAIGVTDRLERAAELAAVVLLRSRTEELLAHAAHHDDLTGLANRAGLRRQLQSAGDDAPPRSVLFVDLDGFKTVNDVHGHSAGDAVLRCVAQRLRSTVRAHDVVARLGGDEFAIMIAAEQSDASTASAIAERVVAALGATIAVEAANVRISASVGVVDVEPGDNLFDAVDSADRAMYVAKRAGGERVHRA